VKPCYAGNAISRVEQYFFVAHMEAKGRIKQGVGLGCAVLWAILYAACMDVIAMKGENEWKCDKKVSCGWQYLGSVLALC
jgi:hypothetical protein